MKKLVRARPKAIEYLPDWAKCCDEFTTAVERLGEMVMDMDDAFVHQPQATSCRYCGDRKPGGVYYPDTADGVGVAAELLDLDEGPLTEDQVRVGS